MLTALFQMIQLEPWLKLALMIGVPALVVLIVVIVLVVVFAKKRKKKVVEPEPEPAVDTSLAERSTIIRPERPGYVLAKNIMYRVGDKDLLEGGRYLIFNVKERSGFVDVRHNGKSGKYKSGATVSLEIGDTFCSESCTALLTKVYE